MIDWKMTDMRLKQTREGDSDSDIEPKLFIHLYSNGTWAYDKNMWYGVYKITLLPYCLEEE